MSDALLLSHESSVLMGIRTSTWPSVARRRPPTRDALFWSTKCFQDTRDQRKIVAEEGRKREIFAPPTLLAPPPFGAPLFPGRGSTLWPTLRGPHTLGPKIQHLRIGRS